MSRSRTKSRRYGKRFSSPYSKWTNGHRHNPTRKRGGRRHPAAKVVRGKA
jgi:hypothetical protein